MRWFAAIGMGVQSLEDETEVEPGLAEEYSLFSVPLSFSLGMRQHLGSILSFQARLSLGLHYGLEGGYDREGFDGRTWTYEGEDRDAHGVSLRIDGTFRIGPLAWRFPLFIGVGPHVGLLAFPDAYLRPALGGLGELGFLLGDQEHLEIAVRGALFLMDGNDPSFELMGVFAIALDAL